MGLYFFILVVVFFASSVASSVKKSGEIAKNVERKKEELTQLKKEQERLKAELERVSSEEYVEKQIRDNLGMSRAGELIVVLPDPEIVKKFSPIVAQEEEVLPDPNWKKWLNLFF